MNLPFSHRLWPLFLPACAILHAPLAAAIIENVWLTHATTDPTHLTVSWETAKPGPSMVEFGTTTAYGHKVETKESTTLHHVDIPVTDKDTVYHYRVTSGKEASEDAAFPTPPTKELRVVIVGDWGYAPEDDLAAIIKDAPHLLLTAGDNVPSLHEKDHEGIKAFSALIARHPALFRSTPFIPSLGNHDREVTARGPKPPGQPVYDIEATAFRQFFALPDKEWIWHFDVPDFNVRFLALDMSHLSDFGTTWQTCHPWQPESEQFKWYHDTMTSTKAAYVFTLMNEKQTAVNGLTQGAWHKEMRNGSAVVTGFGYFAERAELADGLPYFNTCLKGDGSPYKDPQSKYFAQENNYLLLTFKEGATNMTAQLKNLKGEVLDTRVIEKRKGEDKP
ncbi:MAG: hypothetical protein JWO94_3323 [Verrucomicrobiaceae bacterium]|nr:hypothetical protein [Verrucomicrobiaceae bacterium]